MTVGKLKVGLVNYSNALPFKWGLMEKEWKNNFEIIADVPSKLTEKLNNKKIDVGILPLSFVLQNPQFPIINDFCIGCKKKVDSVFLLSHFPFSTCKNLLLSEESQTSNHLAQIIWKKMFPNSSINVLEKEPNLPCENTAKVIIGDRAMEMVKQYRYQIDLGQAWHFFFKLPFVFAVWVAHNDMGAMDGMQIKNLNEALSYGVNNIENLIEKNRVMVKNPNYLLHSINYIMGGDEKKSIQYFKDLLGKGSFK